MLFLILVLVVITAANSIFLLELLKRSGDILCGLAEIVKIMKENARED